MVSQQDNIFTSEELCVSSDISKTTLYELVEHDIATPIEGKHADKWLFSVATVTQIKKAVRIKDDLSLEWSAIPLVLQLINERDELSDENNMLKQRLSQFNHFE